MSKPPAYLVRSRNRASSLDVHYPQSQAADAYVHGLVCTIVEQMCLFFSSVFPGARHTCTFLKLAWRVACISERVFLMCLIFGPMPVPTLPLCPSSGRRSAEGMICVGSGEQASWLAFFFYLFVRCFRPLFLSFLVCGWVCWLVWRLRGPVGRGYAAAVPLVLGLAFLAGGLVSCLPAYLDVSVCLARP